jgi:hypothetical protein
MYGGSDNLIGLVLYSVSVGIVQVIRLARACRGACAVAHIVSEIRCWSCERTSGAWLIKVKIVVDIVWPLLRNSACSMVERHAHSPLGTTDVNGLLCLTLTACLSHEALARRWQQHHLQVRNKELVQHKCIVFVVVSQVIVSKAVELGQLHRYVMALANTHKALCTQSIIDRSVSDSEQAISYHVISTRTEPLEQRLLSVPGRVRRVQSHHDCHEQ